MDLTHAPTAIHKLVEWLETNGFSIVRSQQDGPYHQYALFSSGDMRVEVRATRGDWDIGIGLASMSRIYHPDEWEAWFGRFALAGDGSDLDHQVDYIENQWLGAVSRARIDESAEDEIRAIDQDYVWRRFGIRPPGVAP